nr:unnamed protein product [Callosobruchus chinensis]
MDGSRKYLTEKELEEIVREIEAGQSDDIGFSNDSSDSGTIPYIGKEDRQNTLPIPSQYVLKLSEPTHKTNRNITLDNWFTSVGLTNSLSEVGLTVVGTLRKNKPEIPPEFLKPKISTPNRFAFTQDVVLVSHT